MEKRRFAEKPSDMTLDEATTIWEDRKNDFMIKHYGVDWGAKDPWAWCYDRRWQNFYKTRYSSFKEFAAACIFIWRGEEEDELYKSMNDLQEYLDSLPPPPETVRISVKGDWIKTLGFYHDFQRWMVYQPYGPYSIRPVKTPNSRFTGSFAEDFYDVQFNNTKDAMMFKLSWSDALVKEILK